jgi:dihydrofolate reductase
MGKIVVSEFVTLDGFAQDPGPGEEGPYAAWTVGFDNGPKGTDFKADELRASDALLLGRATYEMFAKAWPAIELGWFSDRFNSMPKYVVASSLDDPSWGETTIIAPDELVQRVQQLRDSDGGDIVVHGSLTLAQALLEHGLVDELRLMVYPIVIGGGRRLFPTGLDRIPLKLVETRTLGDCVALTFHP